MNGNGNGNGGANGNGHGFRPDELVRIQGRDFAVIGGRLRVLHAGNAKVSITTELLDYQLDHHAVVRARVLTEVGEFFGTGVATATRDPKLIESLVELGETRAIARALRFAGIGSECVGFEELGSSPVLEGEQPRHELRRVPAASNRGPCNGNGSGGTPCTSAQRRALQSLARQLGQELEEIVEAVFPDTRPDHLTLTQASSLIDKMRTKANGNGVGASR